MRISEKKKEEEEVACGKISRELWKKYCDGWRYEYRADAESHVKIGLPKKI